MSNYLMVDLETMGICATSIVLSVGAVIFDDEYNIIDKKLWVLDKKEQLKLGRTFNKETIKFWEEQPPEAKKQFITEHLYSLDEFRKDFTTFVNNYNVRLVWSSAPNLDIGCIQTLFDIDNQGDHLPWRFDKIRDLRTIRDYLREYPKRNGVFHNAVDDCIYQIECLKLSVRDMFIYGYNQVKNQLNERN